MVLKCPKMSESLIGDDSTKKWEIPKLDVPQKGHGFLIVPKHPRAIAQEEAQRQKSEEAVSQQKQPVIDESQLKESYQKGFNDAVSEQKSQMESKVQVMQQEMDQQKEKILSLVDALNQSLENYESEIEKNIKEVALRFLKVDKKSHIEYIEQNIKKHLKTHKIYKIYVSNDALEDWIELMPEYKDIFSTKPSLNDLECVVNFDEFFLDGRFEALLKDTGATEED